MYKPERGYNVGFTTKEPSSWRLFNPKTNGCLRGHVYASLNIALEAADKINRKLASQQKTKEEFGLEEVVYEES